MEHYKVSLLEQERAELQSIAGKGMHAASKVINALILLNCDQAGGRAERPHTALLHKSCGRMRFALYPAF